MAKFDDMPRGFGVDPAVFVRPRREAPVEQPLETEAATGPGNRGPEGRPVYRFSRRAEREKLIDGLEHGFDVEGENARVPSARPSIMVISLAVGAIIAGATLAFEWF